MEGPGEPVDAQREERSATLPSDKRKALPLSSTLTTDRTPSRVSTAPPRTAALQAVYTIGAQGRDEHAIRTVTMKSVSRLAGLVFALLVTAPFAANAGGRPHFPWISDTDVQIVVAESVKIGKDKITVVASARIKIGGKNATPTTTERATFVIKRPPLEFNAPNLRGLLNNPRRGEHARRLPHRSASGSPS